MCRNPASVASLVFHVVFGAATTAFYLRTYMVHHHVQQICTGYNEELDHLRGVLGDLPDILHAVGKVCGKIRCILTPLLSVCRYIYADTQHPSPLFTVSCWGR